MNLYLKWDLGSLEKPNERKQKKNPKLGLEIGVRIFAYTM
jgi:hypothetical protein